MGNITHKIRRLKDGQEVLHPGPGMAALWIRGHGASAKVLVNIDGDVRELTSIAAEEGDFVVGPASATDNAIARFDGTTGDLIQNSTPTVEDDGQIGNLTDPTSLQDAATKNYVDNLVATVNVGGAAQNSFLVSGGQVVWQSAYTFTVSAAIYYINGVLYTSPQTNITLTAADSSFDRIDVVVVNDSSAVAVVDGQPSSTPGEPSIDPGTQLKLTIITVAANTTEPPNVVNEVVYTNNVGSPTEYNWSTSGSGFDLNSTNNPRSATKDIEGTTVSAGAYAQGQKGSGTLDPNLYTFLVFYLRSKATWQNKRGLQVSLRSSGVQVGAAITVNQGAFGFASSQTSTYQQIAIPVTQFAITQGLVINQVRVAGFGGSIGFYLDDVSFQGGVTQSGTQGITQEQADARYRLLSVPLVLSAPADITGDLPLANIVQGSALSVLGVAGNATADHADIAAAADHGVLRRSGTTVGFGAIDLSSANAVSGDLALSNIAQGSALSVLGVTGNSTADNASIAAGTDNQVLRRSGTSLAFGAVNLASTNAVTGDLPFANIIQLAGYSVAGVTGSSTADIAAITAGSDGYVLRRSGGALDFGPVPVAGLTTPIKQRIMIFNFNGGGDVIPADMELDIPLSFDGTVVEWTLLADVSGSITIDLWKDAYGSYPPTNADSITASATPFISSGVKNTDDTLSGWTTSFSAGDTFRAHVDSATDITRAVLAVTVQVS